MYTMRSSADTREIGNNVPESHQKTRRTWTPNVQRKRLYSAALDESIPIKMTMAALRDVDKAGGLDEYLLKQSSLKHLGEFGLHLKAQILEARAENAADAQHEASQEATRLQQNQEQRAQIDHAFRGARRIEGPVSQ